MNLQGRALYNLIWLNWLEDSTIPVEPWQIENLRALSTEQLLNRLHDLEIDLNENSFREYAQNALSPEDLVEVFWKEKELDERFDRAYLVLFELWRRLLPQQQSISIFCDELDHLIYLYDQDHLENEEPLEIALDDLKKLLDEQTDLRYDPKILFSRVSDYCAHDLENFIYDYIAEQIELEEMVYASELIDGFYPYVQDERWFEFLRAALLFETNEEESTVLFEQLLDRLQEDSHLDLLLEMARFLVKRGNPMLFLRTVEQARQLIEAEADFQELLALTYQFSKLLEKEGVSKELQDLLKERQGNFLEKKIPPNDPAIIQYCELLRTLSF